MKNPPVHSMTGFSSVEGEVGGSRMRMELKALNHRFLDLKIRLPRELSSAEMPLRAFLQSAFSRGSLEVKVERIWDSENQQTMPELNLPLATHYYRSLQAMQKNLGLPDTGAASIRAIDLATLPEVLSHHTQDSSTEDAWPKLQPLAQEAVKKLTEMRLHEGRELTRVLGEAFADLDRRIDALRTRRQELQPQFADRIREKVKAAFEAYPIAETSVQAALESRISQELALLLDRTDIEEELTRFKGHLAHFRKIMEAGGPVGRKLDFVLQELNREINTLSNKAQDLAMSQEAVTVKTLIEQIREQVMNLE